MRRRSFRLSAASAALAIILAAGSVFAAQSPSYTDVSEDDWYHADVVKVTEAGLLEGDRGMFSPDTALSRAMAAMILYRRGHQEGDPEFDNAPYTDTPAGAWYFRAVGWVTQAGIAEGYEDGTFRPDAAVTREQLAVLLYNYTKTLRGIEGENKGEAQGFDDSQEIRPYASDAMDWAVSAGILRGAGTRLFPSRPVTRAEAAAMLSRWIGLSDR